MLINCKPFPYSRPRVRISSPGRSAKQREVMKTDFCPEFADRSGNQIGVLVQIGGCGQGLQFAALAEPFDILQLGLGDFIKHALNCLAIGLAGSIEPGENFRQGLDQPALTLVRLKRGKRLLEIGENRAGVVILNRRSERQQRFLPQTLRQLRGIGNRIRGPSQQISEADRFSEPARK